MSQTPKQIACPLCKQGSRRVFIAKDYNRNITEERFPYARCSKCGTLFLEEIPTDLGSYYPQEYYSFPKTPEECDAWAESESYKIDLLRPFAASGRLLEIGPSSGRFAYLAKRAGYSVETIEQDQHSVDFLNHSLHIPTVQATEVMTSLPQTPTYDAIVLWHVIEHLIDPRVVLIAINKALKNGAVLLIAAPDPSSFQCKLFGTRWAHLDAPRHLRLVPQKMYIDLLKNFGYELLFSTTSDPGGIMCNAFGWIQSCIHASKLSSPHVRFTEKCGEFGKILAAAFAPFEQAFDRGSTYTLIFRKSEVSNDFNNTK